jgi:hypothetical protein
MNKQTNGQTEQMDKWANKLMEKWTKRQTNRRTNRQTDKRTKRQTNKPETDSESNWFLHLKVKKVRTDKKRN